MNFEPSDEQRLLSDAARRFVADRYDMAQRRRSMTDARGYSPEVWSTFAELGWLGVPLSEDVGGFGGGPVDLMVLMEALGRGVVIEPYLANVVLAGGLLARAGGDVANGLLERMITGETQLALAYAEPQARFDLNDVRTRAVRQGNGWRIDGGKSMVLNARAADTFIVICRTTGDQRDNTGLSAFAVPASAEGVRVRPYHNNDGTSSGNVELNGVVVDGSALIGAADGALPWLAQVIDMAAFAECANAVGAMEWTVDNPVSYLKTRVQFGKPLSVFQTLQHRLVDMYIAMEEMRSLTMAAALSFEMDESESRKAVSAARVHLGTVGKKFGEEAIQMHGGIGMTDEFPVGHYYKRILAAGTLFGSGDHHLGRLGELLAAG